MLEIIALVNAVLVFVVFAFAFMAGWTHSRMYHAKVEKRNWRLLHQLDDVVAGRRFLVWLDTEGLKFKISYGNDNAVLTGDVPPSHIGVDDSILTAYIITKYIRNG